MLDRLRVTLSGGPFDRAIILVEPGTFEAGMAKKAKGKPSGDVHLYEIKGTHGSYIGPRPIEWLDRREPSVGPWPEPGSMFDGR